MESKAGRDWRSILLAIASLGGAALALAMAVLVLAYQAALTLGGDRQMQPLLDAVLLASAILFVGALLIPPAYYSIQRLIGRPVAAETTGPMTIRAGVLLVLAWLGVTALAQIFYGNSLLRWITPPFYILSIGLPVYFFARLAIGGLSAGSRQGTWGALGSGMLLGPSLAGFVELAMVVFLLIGVGIYLAFDPAARIGLDLMRQQLNSASNPDTILNLLSPYLIKPAVIALALLFFSVIAPAVEETAKSLTAWAVFDHLSSPSRGFVIGALSGTGFGMVESLLASVQPDPSWATTLFVRGGTTMMHILTASLTGWGIAWFRAHHRPGRMIGAYAAAMFLHGLWNGCVIVVLVGSVHAGLGTRSENLAGTALIVLGLSILTIVTLVVPFALGLINRRLRLAETRVPIQGVAEDKNLEGVK
ncbi:MAG TPA: PrsW family glutamic-type intramembrane protease [Anaerolineales bacterium]|nr:PrsW family glutamic-type intramembrane protease [Anaerolineales bacterium]